LFFVYLLIIPGEIGAARAALNKTQGLTPLCLMSRWWLDIFPYLERPFYNEGLTKTNEDGAYTVDTPGTPLFGFHRFEFQTFAVCPKLDGTLMFLGGMRWSTKEFEVYSWVWRFLGGYADSHDAWRPVKKLSAILKPTQDVEDILDLFNGEFKPTPPWRF